MINAEFVAAGEERIIIPTAYRFDYIGALKAFSQSGRADPLIRMLGAAQACTHSIDWTSMATAQAQLTATNTFAEGEDAKLKLARSRSSSTGLFRQQRLFEPLVETDREAGRMPRIFPNFVIADVI
ncbi:hypothetical protein EDF58_1113 [Novosphingobium sp. PhB57]|uniref:hypothetical protein n=1 Tax=Novosphingobium sp. PhB57 TaxID=2485107 RepID=UPI0010D94771|nr:hypothetical protein [Novosphingobium sp. PhB57]TCU53590.1 hypothetical protein EDF58_1113 [Novosphingobium sp. PhB57]